MAPPSSPVAAWSQYLGARIAEMLLTVGDPAVSLRMADRVGAWICALNARHRDRAFRHIAVAYPDLSPDQVEALVLRSFKHFARLLVEICYVPRILHATNWMDHVRLGPIARAAELLNAGKAAIVLTGHLGNWEVLGNTFTVMGYPLHAIARPIDNPLVNDWLLGIRRRRGMEIITKWDASEQMIDVLRSGGVLGFIADQNAGDRGMFVPFFGRLASTYKSIALLAVTQRVPIICGYAQRVEPGLQFDFGVDAVIEPDEWADQDDPVYYVTARYVHVMEQQVRRCPEQYLWMHRRWRSRPVFERKGRPMPRGLRDRLAQLPWMTDSLMRRLVETSEPARSETT